MLAVLVAAKTSSSAVGMLWDRKCRGGCRGPKIPRVSHLTNTTTARHIKVLLAPSACTEPLRGVQGCPCVFFCGKKSFAGSIRSDRNCLCCCWSAVGSNSWDQPPENSYSATASYSPPRVCADSSSRRDARKK